MVRSLYVHLHKILNLMVTPLGRCRLRQRLLRVLWPVRTSMFSGNNQSYVLQLVYGQSRILFTGDIEEAAELELQNINSSLKSQVLKVPHHGSKSSSSLAFLSSVQPEWAVISCDSLVHGHPHEQTLNALRLVMENDNRLLRTDQEGDIEFRIFENRIEYTE